MNEELRRRIERSGYGRAGFAEHVEPNEHMFRYAEAATAAPNVR